MTVLYMIENTADNTFWTNNGFKKDYGTVYKSIKPAQAQINTGKLAMFIGTGFGQIDMKHMKISKFNLTRTE